MVRGSANTSCESDRPRLRVPRPVGDDVWPPAALNPAAHRRGRGRQDGVGRPPPRLEWCSMKLVVQEFLTPTASPRARGPRTRTPATGSRGVAGSCRIRRGVRPAGRHPLSPSGRVPVRPPYLPELRAGLAEMTDHPFAGILNGLPKYGLPQPDQGRGPDHDPVRRRPRPGRRTEAAARPGTADPRQRPAGPVPAGRRADRWLVPVIALVAGRGRRLFPDGGAPVGLRLVSHQTTPCGLSVHTFDTTGLPSSDLRGRRIGTAGPARTEAATWSNSPSPRRSLMIPYTFRRSRGCHEGWSRPIWSACHAAWASP